MTTPNTVPLLRRAAALVAALTGAAAVLATATAAHAAPQAVYKGTLLEPPVLAGPNVVFAARTAKKQAFYSAAPGAKPKVALVLPPDPSDGDDQYSYDASASRLAFVRERNHVNDNGEII